MLPGTGALGFRSTRLRGFGKPGDTGLFERQSAFAFDDPYEAVHGSRERSRIEAFHRSGGPAHFQPIDLGCLSKAKVQEVHSLGGIAMMFGLGAGSWIGLKYLLWEIDNVTVKPIASKKKVGAFLRVN